MRKKITMLLALVLCAFTSSVMAQTYYTPGERTTTLEAGKKYFISVATWYNGDACTNLLRNNGGTLAKSDKLPDAVVYDEAFLFTVEEVGDGYLAYIKNSDSKYIQADNLASTETKTGVYVIPYYTGKAVCCGNDVDACDEDGDKIAYADIDDDTPIVTVQKNSDYTNSDNRNGWRYIGGLSAGVNWCTAFAFYEAKEVADPFEVTTDESNPIYYTIKNVRGNAYAEYDGASRAMLLKSSVTSAANLFYFTAGTKTGTYKIHNAATSNNCAATNSWTANGIDWYIKVSGNTSYSGYAIANQETLTDGGDTNEAWNDFQNAHTSIATYGGNDAGSVWAIEKYTAEVPAIKMSTESEKHLYFIKNDRVNKFANYVKSGSAFTETPASNYGSYWYFVEKTDAENVPEGFKACYIYNAANDKPVQNHSNGYMSAVDDATYPAKVYLVGTHESTYWGYVIYPQGSTNGWNDSNGTSVTDYNYDDAGSIWSILPADKTESTLKNEAATAKANALSFIANAEAADYYTYSDEAIATAKSAVEGVNTNVLASAVEGLLNNTFGTALTTLKSSERGTTAPAAGEYIQLKNREHSQYLKANAEDAENSANKSDLATLWLVEAGDGTNVKLKNASTGKYIGEIRKSATVSMVSSEEAKQFTWTNQEDIYAVFHETTGLDAAYGHVNGGKLVGWYATSYSTQWGVSREVVTLPEVGKYYFIECPLFYGVQGVKKALYSNGTNPRWKTLDVADKSFYWTVEQTENGYVLKNANDNKYVLGKAANQTSWTMETETTGAEYTIELAGEGQVFIKIAGRHLHANNHNSGNGGESDIVSWETSEANTASAWAFVTTDNPEWGVAKISLQKRVDELTQVVDNATDKIGYYKSSEAAKLVGPIATAQSVLDGGSTEAETYTGALTNLNSAVEGVDMNVILPVEGKFYRFKHPTADAYMLSDETTKPGSTAKRLAMGGLEANKVSSIFYYGEDGTLLSYANGRYLSNAEAASTDDWTCLAVGTTGSAATFGAGSALGRVGFYLTSGRAYWSGHQTYVDAGGTFGSNAGYDWVVEEVEWLPVAINTTVGYATFYSPVELELSQGRVKAYTGKVDGNVFKLTEQNVVPANTGVILELQEGAEVENGYTFLQVKETTLTDLDNDLIGTFAKTYVAGPAYVLSAPTVETVGLYKAQLNKDSEGNAITEGETGTHFLNNAFKAYLSATAVPSGAQALRFTRGGDDETTSIDNAQLTIDNVVIYDLQGRRVEKMEKGIYIVNGKKVIR